MVADIGSRDRSEELPVARVLAEVGMQEGRAGRHGLGGVEQRRKLFVLDLDQIQGFQGGVFVDGGHAGHRLAHVTNAVHGVNGLIGQHHPPIRVGVVRSRNDRPDSRQTLRPLRIDAQNPGMGQGASQDLRVEHPGPDHVRPVHRHPARLLVTVPPLVGGPDPG